MKNTEEAKKETETKPAVVPIPEEKKEPVTVPVPDAKTEEAKKKKNKDKKKSKKLKAKAKVEEAKKAALTKESKAATAIYQQPESKTKIATRALENSSTFRMLGNWKEGEYKQTYDLD